MILFDRNLNKIGEITIESDLLVIQFFDAITHAAVGKLRTREQESNEIIRWVKNNDQHRRYL